MFGTVIGRSARVTIRDYTREDEGRVRDGGCSNGAVHWTAPFGVIENGEAAAQLRRLRLLSLSPPARPPSVGRMTSTGTRAARISCVGHAAEREPRHPAPPMGRQRHQGDLLGARDLENRVDRVPADHRGTRRPETARPQVLDQIPT